MSVLATKSKVATASVPANVTYSGTPPKSGVVAPCNVVGQIGSYLISRDAVERHRHLDRLTLIHGVGGSVKIDGQDAFGGDRVATSWWRRPLPSDRY